MLLRVRTWSNSGLKEGSQIGVHLGTLGTTTNNIFHQYRMVIIFQKRNGLPTNIFFNNMAIIIIQLTGKFSQLIELGERMTRPSYVAAALACLVGRRADVFDH
jgi:hypothetical protein